MHPILFATRLGGHPVTVGAYGFFLAVGVLVTLTLGFILATRAGVPKWRAAVILVACGVTGLFGARLLNATVHGHLGGDFTFLFAPGLHSFSLYGALMIGCAVAVALSRLLRVARWGFLDALVPGTALGIAIARVGCFLNGCCFGTRTTAPTGVTFPRGSLPWLYDLAHGGPSLFGGSVAVHPTQLYEIGGVLGTLAVAFGVARSRWTRAVPGVRFLVFVTVFSVFRLVNLAFRAPVFATAVPVWFYPLLYGILISGCSAVMFVRTRRCALAERGPADSITAGSLDR